MDSGYCRDYTPHMLMKQLSHDVLAGLYVACAALSGACIATNKGLVLYPLFAHALKRMYSETTDYISTEWQRAILLYVTSSLW